MKPFQGCLVMGKPTIVISIRGGCVESVARPTGQEVVIYDWDNINENEPKKKRIEQLQRSWEEDVEGLEVE